MNDLTLFGIEIESFAALLSKLGKTPRSKKYLIERYGSVENYFRQIIFPNLEDYQIATKLEYLNNKPITDLEKVIKLLQEAINSQLVRTELRTRDNQEVYAMLYKLYKSDNFVDDLRKLTNKTARYSRKYQDKFK